LFPVIGLLALLVVVALAGPAVSPAADAQALVGDLVEAQVRLVERAREYRTSLERLLAVHEADAERAEARERSRRELLERGIVSRREMEESERLSERARGEVEATRRRMAEADALMSETLAAIELAKVPKAQDTALVATPAVIRYQGGADLTAVEAGNLESFFRARFGRSLPVSARGQTPVHDRLGLDHRRALDVAVHPDSDEGQALIEYLRLRGVPFLAFRKPIPGASTGAHLHVGPSSAPLASVRATGR
jgi:hypothetical protein